MSPILNFFQKIEFIHSKTTQMNAFPGGIKKSANIGQKKEGSSAFQAKLQKKGVFLP